MEGLSFPAFCVNVRLRTEIVAISPSGPGVFAAVNAFLLTWLRLPSQPTKHEATRVQGKRGFDSARFIG